jgi:sortase A
MHRLGTVLLVLGALALLWAVLIWRWQDPFTALYTKYQQRELASQYEAYAERYAPVTSQGTSPTITRREIAAAAKRYRLEATEGQAIGRIVVPRIGVSMVLVNGTETDTLKQGPGRHRRTFMPGEGQLVYIAGHRTTYGAPFSKIDAMRVGDLITLRVPYAEFVYRVTRHRVVSANETSVLKSQGREVVILQACEPRFFATHRYLVYGKLLRITPPGGPALPVR